MGMRKAKSRWAGGVQARLRRGGFLDAFIQRARPQSRTPHGFEPQQRVISAIVN
jgi:hypothetical protein